MLNLTFRNWIWSLSAILIALPMGVFYISAGYVNESKINGPVYTQIVRDKDLVADVLPPPEYIIEPYLLVLQMQRVRGEALEILIRRFQDLRKDYEARHGYWEQQALAEELRAKLLEQSYRPAMQFFQTVAADYLPALRNGDAARADQTLRRLEGHYDAHRAAIDELVVLANAESKAIELRSDELLAKISWLMPGLMGLSLLLGVILSLFIGRRLIRRLKLATDSLRNIELGTLDAPVPLSGARDEIEDLLRSTAAVQDSLERLMQDTDRLLGDAAAGKLDSRADAGRHQGGYARIVTGINQAIDGFVDPLRQLLDGIAKLNDAVAQGRLNVRLEPEQHGGEFAAVAKGINLTLDSIIAPLNVAADYVDRISKGDIPAKIATTYHGDFNAIKNNLNTAIDSLERFISGMRQMAADHEAGEIDSVIAVDQFQGAYRTMAEAVNDMVGAHIAVKRKAIAVFKAFGEGNFNAPLEPLPGKRAFINQTIEQVRDDLKALISDTELLTQTARDGALSVRADASRHHGDFRKIIEGINQTLDEVVDPLHVAADYVARIAKGEIPPRITTEYRGDFNLIKNNLNTAIDTLDSFIGEMRHMAAEHEAGDIDMRIGVTHFQGAYHAMAKGVNDMVQAHIDLNRKAMTVVKAFGEGDFQASLERFPGKKAFINETVEHVRSDLMNIAADVDMLAQAALDGRIQQRADASRHRGDFRKIVDGLNATLDTLLMPIITIKEATDAIHTAANEISLGNQSLSERTEEQASSLEETASSMEQLAAGVRQNTENARHSDELAVMASEVAQRGGEAVRNVVRTMDEINESSQKIVDIIGVIDGIAFQTNILALNAAVEAARAGEHGKGFAVVAEEVRTLAHNSATAAKEIKALIQLSAERTEAGTLLVKAAGHRMEEIVDAIKQVHNTVADIAAASEEQRAGIEQINQAVSQMDHVTQQNAALVEEAAAAAESLDEQAASLAKAAARFKLDRTASDHRPTAETHGRTPARRPQALPRPMLASLSQA